MVSKLGRARPKRAGPSPKRRRSPPSPGASEGSVSPGLAEPAPERDRDDSVPVVGLGASAGGLEALETFFSHMPGQSGLAFVVVTHQHPGHASVLGELLGRKTAMPVVEVSRATPVQPDHVYLSRPGYNLAILHGVLQPMAVDKQTALHLPVDYFFRSLAHDGKDRAIAVILSGTGSDGTLGLKEVKAELGMVMVQETQSAQYAGMPHSAISTELVDYVLPVAQMPEQLLAYAETLMAGRPHAVRRAEPPLAVLQQIFVQIRDRTGHDFSHYKRSTIGRRIERRMNLHRIDSLKLYLAYLQANAGEVSLLFKELLIGVTSFFRDPAAWDALAPALAGLLARKPDDYVLRAWVPGCSTGEEAYSLAILLRETMDELRRSVGVQIFATDLDGAAIDLARAGSYPAGIASDVSQNRLARFFTAQGDCYSIRKEIREMLIFAPQNLIADPPFTKLDLLSCRNLLIYLDAALQRRLVPIFHYALKPDGLLFLGSSESVGSSVELFSAVDKKWKVFRRLPGAATYPAEFPALTTELSGDGVSRWTRPQVSAAPKLEQVVDKMLLRDVVPPTVVVRERGDVVHVHGRTGLFLEPAQGSQTTANVFNMARKGLQLGLSAAIRQAAATGTEVVERGVQVKSNGHVIRVDVRVQRLSQPEALRGLFRVTFEHAYPMSPDQEAEGTGTPPDRLVELEQALQYSKESHQATIEELETSNEELKSTNEELQSTNEELQSANEELETSKEEMQSLNEELQTVNAELEGKVDQLSGANNDMKNLLNATDIAMLFLDRELRIKRYTEQAKQVIRLIPTDVGRPIGDLASSLHYDQLLDEAREVLRTLAPKETSVRSENGKFYLLRILPYRTTDNVIDGLVLTFVDVTTLKGLQEEQDRLLGALRGSLASLIGQDRQLRVTWASSAVFGKSPAELIGKADAELFAEPDAGRLRELKRRVLEHGTAEKGRIGLTLDGEKKVYDLYMEPKRSSAGEINGLACLVIDVTRPA